MSCFNPLFQQSTGHGTKENLKQDTVRQLPRHYQVTCTERQPKEVLTNYQVLIMTVQQRVEREIENRAIVKRFIFES